LIQVLGLKALRVRKKAFKTIGKKKLFSSPRLAEVIGLRCIGELLAGGGLVEEGG